MSEASPIDTMVDLLDAVVYGDVFDCAVTFDELWRYSLVAVDREELRQRVGAPPVCDVVVEQDGLFVLRGREDLVDRRFRRQARARELRRRARSVAGCLQHFPFVRGILLTGSVAADDADEGADVDMLVIVQPRRLGLAFVVLASLSRLLSRDVFCPNYYLSEAHLALSRRDHYVARELMQAVPLAGGAVQLLAANPWTSSWLPNAAAHGDAGSPLPCGRVLQRLLELPFRGAIGDRLEGRAHALALRRLAVHHAGFGGGLPETITERFAAGVELRFHGGALVERVADRYAERRAAVHARLTTAAAASAQ